MAIVGTTVALSTTTATLIVAAGPREINDPLPGTIVNPTGSGSTVYIGGASVASTGAFGIPLYVTGSFPFALIGNDSIYAIAATGTPTIAYLLGRQ